MDLYFGLYYLSRILFWVSKRNAIFLLYLLFLVVVFFGIIYFKILFCSKALGYEILRNVCIQIFFYVKTFQCLNHSTVDQPVAPDWVAHWITCQCMYIFFV